MNINQIMEELLATFEFSKNHSFSTINLDVVAISEAHIRIKCLVKKYCNNFNMLQAILDKIYMGIEKAKEKELISGYELCPEGLKILPQDMKLYEKYPTKEHYILIAPKLSSSIA